MCWFCWGTVCTHFTAELTVAVGRGSDRCRFDLSNSKTQSFGNRFWSLVVQTTTSPHSHYIKDILDVVCLKSVDATQLVLLFFLAPPPLHNLIIIACWKPLTVTLLLFFRLPSCPHSSLASSSPPPLCWYQSKLCSAMNARLACGTCASLPKPPVRVASSASAVWGKQVRREIDVTEWCTAAAAWMKWSITITQNIFLVPVTLIHIQFVVMPLVVESHDWVWQRPF